MGENHFTILREEIKQELISLKQLTEECTEFYKSNKMNIDTSANLR